MSVLDRVGQIQESFRKAIERLEKRSYAFSVFVGALRDFNEDNCMHLAAGVAYYAIFSIFPLMLGLIALSSFMLQSAEARDAVVAGVTSFLPGSAELVRRNIDLVLRERGAIGLLATVTLLWSAKAVFGAITTSLNLAWNVKETRGFFHITVLELGMVFGVGFFLMVSFLATALVQLVFILDVPIFGRASIVRDAWALLAGLIPLVLTIVAFFIVYRSVPNTHVASKHAWPGAIVAGVLFEIAKNIFVLYTSEFANYHLVYGSISAVVALLFWTWISSVILLFGAEICSQHARGRRQ